MGGGLCGIDRKLKYQVGDMCFSYSKKKKRKKEAGLNAEAESPCMYLRRCIWAPRPPRPCTRTGLAGSLATQGFEGQSPFSAKDTSGDNPFCAVCSVASTSRAAPLKLDYYT